MLKQNKTFYYDSNFLAIFICAKTLTYNKDCKTDCICIQFQNNFPIERWKNRVANHTQIYHNYAYDERQRFYI